MTISLTTENNEQSYNQSAPLQHINSDIATIAKGQSILLIENDQLLSNAFKQYLNTHGYSVHQKRRDETIERSLVDSRPEMVILDIGFSDHLSLAIIKNIRALYKGPLVLLTSRVSEQEQIMAFNLGVDEYLIKPISEHILLVRVAALFRLQGKPRALNEQTSIDLGDLTLHPVSLKCQINGGNVALTQFEFKLLRLLVENEGRIMSRDDIYSTLLGRIYNGVERTVDVRVSQLRDKLAQKGLQKLRIETIWGQGYMLNQIE